MVLARSLLPALLAGLLVAAAPAGATAPASCSGTGSISPTATFTGSFSTARQGAYVMLPLSVPKGITQLRVRYCWDKPENGVSGGQGHTLDLGIYDALRKGDRVWGAKEFRGWGGSSHPEVAISRQGFSSQAEYLANPKGYVPGRTTRGFEPGPIRSGRWAIELGVAAVIPRSAGDATGEVGWRVEVELSRDKAFAAHPYKPARYRTAPVRRTAGWYAGDFHVHDEHSNLGAATISETLGYAFRPLSRDGAGLDFTALSDYVTDTAWGEIGRWQPRYPRRLIIPSAEVITYHGHLANQNAGGWVDYRTGPILERAASGALKRLRGPTPPRSVFASIHRLGGFTVINHPRIFPPVNPTVAALCRGCYWGYADAQTSFRRVDAIEVMNSIQALGGDPANPNPYTADGIAYWQHALATGAHVAALGGSDTHDAGRPNGALSAPLGHPATMVYADELSAGGVQRAVQDGHTYVKALGAGGPDLRLTAKTDHGRTAMMGDSLSGFVRITASAGHATGGAARVLELQRDGVTIATRRFTGPSAKLTWITRKRGRYGVVVVRDKLVEALSSPIYLNEPRTRLRAAFGGRVRRRGNTLEVPCRGTGTDVRTCVAGASHGPHVVRASRLLTGGRATVTLRLPRALRRGRLSVGVFVVDRVGAPSGPAVRKVRLS